jgi:hypothetical protein
MPLQCHNPTRERHEIPEGDRRVSLVRIDWGKADLREGWEGEYRFCSFRCLAEWAAEKADQHDGRVLVEGEPTEPEEAAA